MDPKGSRRSKIERQGLIERVLAEHVVSSQLQLMSLLHARKLSVGQATISRDLAELGASLIRDDSGETRYILPDRDSAPISPRTGLERAMADNVIDVRRSGDMIVLITPPARAAMVSFAADRARVAGVLGTIAGDDTVLVVCAAGRGAAVERLLRSPRA